jgi:hypothetical protein
MQKYIRLVKKGKRLYSDLGRPRLLDRISIASIKDYCIDESDLNKNNLKVEIESEYINTLVRRNAIDIELAEMSRSSLKRYLDDF